MNMISKPDMQILGPDEQLVIYYLLEQARHHDRRGVKQSMVKGVLGYDKEIKKYGIKKILQALENLGFILIKRVYLFFTFIILTEEGLNAAAEWVDTVADKDQIKNMVVRLEKCQSDYDMIRAMARAAD